MAARIIKRLLIAIFLVLGVVSIAFVLLHVLPGDPSTRLLSPRMSPPAVERLRAQYGLDRPLHIQYGLWLWSFFRGDLGFSFSQQREVLDVLQDALPYTILLALAAVSVELLLGTLLALAAVRTPNSFIDKILSIGGLIMYTLPTFWIAILLVSVFSYGLGLLPSSQVHSVGADHLSSFDYALDFLQHLVLPVLAIGLPGSAGVARFLRANFLKVYQEEYILAAQSLGLSRSRIFRSYAFPNAVPPVITILGLEFGALLSGALVVETVFAWPGLGQLALTAIFARDYPLVLGCTTISGLGVIGANLLADIVSSLIDPRLKIEV